MAMENGKQSSTQRLRQTLQVIRQVGGDGALFRRLLDKAFWHSLLVLRESFCPSPRPFRLPSQFQFEIADACNLECPMCSRSLTSRRPARFMSLADFRFFLSRLGKKPDHVSLNGIGEPLLCPDLLPIIDLLAKRGITCSFFSNGILFTHELIEALAKRFNLTQIGISCDSPDPKTYERLRLGAQFEHFRGNLARLVQAFTEAGNKASLLFNMVLNRENAHQMAEMIRFTARVGIPRLEFFGMIPNRPEIALPDRFFVEIDRIGLVELAASLGIFVAFSFRNLVPVKMARCVMPYDYVFVAVDGDIRPCCMVIDPATMPLSPRSPSLEKPTQVFREIAGSELGLGNLGRTPLPNIWWGKPYQAFREAFSRGAQTYCQACWLYSRRRAEMQNPSA